jgi:mxaD protein
MNNCFVKGFLFLTPFYLGNNMKKITLLVSSTLLFVSGMASAHGPVRGKMTATVPVDAPAEKVWDLIKNYDDMSWLPVVESVKADKGNEKGSVRVITLKEGGTITEEMKKYDAQKMSYKYKITEMSTVKTIQHAGQDENIPVLPVENYQATISVKANGDKSTVKWVATYYRGYVNNNPPEELNEAAADKGVTAVLTSGLTNIAQQFDSSVESSAVTFKMKR